MTSVTTGVYEKKDAGIKHGDLITLSSQVHIFNSNYQNAHISSLNHILREIMRGNVKWGLLELPLPVKMIHAMWHYIVGGICSLLWALQQRPVSSTTLMTIIGFLHTGWVDPVWEEGSTKMPPTSLACCSPTTSHWPNMLISMCWLNHVSRSRNQFREPDGKNKPAGPQRPLWNWQKPRSPVYVKGSLPKAWVSCDTLPLLPQGKTPTSRF